MPELARRMETPLEIPPLKKKGAFSFKEHEEFYDEEVVDALDGRSLDQLEKWGDRYRVLDGLGEGGMGKAVLALDEQTGRVVVIKRLHQDLTRYEHMVLRFKREMRTLAKSKNPFIVKAHDVIEFPTNYGSDAIDLGLVMEYVKGKDLFDMLRDARYFNEERAAEVAIQICLALQGAYDLGIVHRDLKPENVFLDEDGHVRVGDFGIAGFARETPPTEIDSSGRTLTAEGTVFGTPEYIAPEVGMGERADGRADLYAVGIIMYRMLAGHLPFRGGNKMSLIQRQISELPKPFSGVNMPEENKDTELEPIVMKLLEKDPKERYQTANETARAIARVIFKKHPKLRYKEPYIWLSEEAERASKETPEAQEKRAVA